MRKGIEAAIRSARSASMPARPPLPNRAAVRTLQRFGLDHQCRRTLDHRHVSAVLPQIGRDIVRRIVGADDDASLAGIGCAVPMLARMMRNARKRSWPLNSGRFGHAGHAGRQNQLRRIQRYGSAFALNLDGPALAASSDSARLHVVAFHMSSSMI